MRERGEFLEAMSTQPTDAIGRLRSVAESPLNGVGVELLAAILAVELPTADAAGDHRVVSLEPTEFVDLVDVHLGEESAGDPRETGEIADLPHQLADTVWLLAHAPGRMDAVRPDEDEFAQLSLADPLD